MKNKSLFNDALQYVTSMQKQVSEGGNCITIADVPNLRSYEEYFPETIYYVSNIGKAKYDYLSPNIQDISGLTAQEATNMHLGEFVNKAFHPDDIPMMFRNFEMFNAFLKKTPFEKIKDLIHFGSFRIMTKSGEYKNVFDQSIVIECAADQGVNKLFGAVSVAPPRLTNRALSVVIDSSNGNEVERFDLLESQALDILTTREFQILRLLALAYRNKEVAEKLFISVHTVETHRKNIMRKLGLSNPLDLVWKALELNVLDSKDVNEPVEE